MNRRIMTLIYIAILLLVMLCCWHITLNVVVSIVGPFMAIIVSVTGSWMFLIISEHREKGQIDKENKNKYQKYKKKHPKPVEFFKTQIKENKMRRECCIEFGKDYGLEDLYYYNFAQKSNIEYHFIVEDRFIELLKEEIGT